MLKQSLLGIFVIIMVILTSCSTNNGGIQPRVTDDVLKETWIQQINTNPNNWIKDADPWFLTGEPNLTQVQSATAPLYRAITTSSVRVPNFDSIMIHGDFQVQIVGGQHQNSVYIYGPNAEAQQVSVEIFKNRLMLRQNKSPTGNMQNVIVRIGICNLRSIYNMGNGLVLGRTITSDKLKVVASGGGSILLDGNMNLQIVEQTGMGTITILGAFSQKLSLMVNGPGNVNISGRMGVDTILHQGSGTINLIGADSDSLCISTGGSGLTTVFGYVNLKEVVANDSSRVYVYWVFSKNINVLQNKKSIVGLGGSTANLTVELTGASCFLGQYLRSGAAYVKANGHSHAGVSADQKIFASATGRSGILFYGSPGILSKYTSEQGTIIPLGNNISALPNPPFIPYEPMKCCGPTRPQPLF